MMDILNVQGWDAEYLLDEMNFIRARLLRPMPEIVRRELESDIEKWQMILEDSGHLVELTPGGYQFKRRRQTGPLPAIQIPLVKNEDPG